MIATACTLLHTSVLMYLLPMLSDRCQFAYSFCLYKLHWFQADVDGNGSIDYTEFITATMHMNKMEKEDHLFAAFEYFDKDHSG